MPKTSLASLTPKEVRTIPRPRKWRRVCCLPDRSRFGPLDAPADAEGAVKMAVDEYETIRLIDRDGLTQEECAAQMNISRTTVQGIYFEARKKLAEALVYGKMLRIEGGEYRLCDARGPGCGGGGCCRRHCGLDYGEDWEDSAIAISSDQAGDDEQSDADN